MNPIANDEEHQQALHRLSVAMDIQVGLKEIPNVENLADYCKSLAYAIQVYEASRYPYNK